MRVAVSGVREVRVKRTALRGVKVHVVGSKVRRVREQGAAVWELKCV